jgi:hypothetical protein
MSYRVRTGHSDDRRVKVLTMKAPSAHLHARENKNTSDVCFLLQSSVCKQKSSKVETPKANVGSIR